MTDHTYAFNSLTNFEYEANTMTGNGNHENFLKIIFKIREITLMNLFLAGFGYLEPLCTVPRHLVHLNKLYSTVAAQGSELMVMTS
jgi:hypothetical protein